jgi:ABC-type nickel/cobalt efflux system permease component RcnA
MDGFLIIFWYGILHAFGPDHLTAIADFSIGKDKKKTLMITTLFAIGHGIMLFIFAKILSTFIVDETILSYGDTISSTVIFLMGIYLLFMALTNRINLNKHVHNGKEHIHIYFGKEHEHSNRDIGSAFTMGVLMGIGGVRGMLITLGAINNNDVNFYLVLAFTAGVMLIFLFFGLFIMFINENLLKSKKQVRTIFAFAGITSIGVASSMLF